MSFSSRLLEKNCFKSLKMIKIYFSIQFQFIVYQIVDEQGSYWSWKTWKVLELYCHVTVLESPGKKAAGPSLKSSGNFLNSCKKYEMYCRQ